ncbi:unnamed protein product [Polarella glacialis]|uniref:Uncharacterized protein n=1 Tax=Polarella glacialis TaxID=89957 RepID=A0A813J6Z5_POLGL|nr:unnamed protein product [Polarella glacialis]
MAARHFVEVESSDGEQSEGVLVEVTAPATYGVRQGALRSVFFALLASTAASFVVLGVLRTKVASRQTSSAGQSQELPSLEVSKELIALDSKFLSDWACILWLLLPHYSSATFASDSCFHEFPGGWWSRCFCQLADNPACRSEPCACKQGCGAEVTYRHTRSTSFVNYKRAWGCGAQSNRGLLTIPQSFFHDIRSLKNSCPGAQELLAEMLRGSFRTYGTVAGPGPVRQCIHAAGHVSQGWLHLHTFCQDGHLDNMPNAYWIAWCGSMSSIEQMNITAPLATEVHGLCHPEIRWAERLYGPMPTAAPLPMAAPLASTTVTVMPGALPMGLPQAALDSAELDLKET